MTEELNKKVSVVISTYHREEPLVTTLRYFLERENYFDFELILIDQSENHLPDTRAYLDLVSTKIRYVRADFIDLCKARNKGIELAQGEIVLFVDDDVEPFPHFIKEHVDLFSDPRVMGGGGPSIAPGQKLRSREDLGEKLYQCVKFEGRAFCDVDFSHFTNFVSGCNMSFRKMVFDRIGGFDENILSPAIIGDDADFCKRVIESGGKILYSPKPALIHHQLKAGGTRAFNDDRKMLRQFVSNAYYFWCKNHLGRKRKIRDAIFLYKRRLLLKSYLFHPVQFVLLSVTFWRSIWQSQKRFRKLLSENKVPWSVPGALERE